MTNPTVAIANVKKPGLKGLKLPTPFSAVILHARKGRRLAKLYRDPTQRPDDYEAGHLFTATEISAPTFEAFVQKLAALSSDACLIRGGVRDVAQADVQAGCEVRRLAYDREECPAAFEPVERNWIVLDADDTATPFDRKSVRQSVDAWRKTLPVELQTAQSAFFLSASSHISDTVRGKLVVALATPLDDCSAATYANANGFDGSVCHAVQPNYFAAPIFEGCADPLQGKRAPIMFNGNAAILPQLPPSERKQSSAPLFRESTPDDLPEISERGKKLGAAILERWYEGDRIITNAWLHLAGWCLGKGWSKGEVGAMLNALDVHEDPIKQSEHLHILNNASPIDGPGGARDWLGEDFERVSAIVNYDAGITSYAARLAERNARAAYALPEAANDDSSDDLGRIVDWSTPVTPIRYLCEGLGIGWVAKCAGIHGYAGSAKGLLLARIALSAASGLSFIGFNVERVPVLYCDAETGALAENRIKRLAIAMGLDLGALVRDGWWRFRHVSMPLAKMLGDGLLARHAKEIDRGNGSLLALDSYSSLVGGDENCSEYADPLWALGQLGQRVNAIPVCTFHERKGREQKGPASPLEGISGTNRLAAGLAASIRLTSDEDNDRIITVGCTRAPETRFEAIKLEWRDTPAGGITALADTLHIPSREELCRARDAAKAEKHLLSLDRRCSAVVDYLGRCISANITARKIKDVCSLNGRQWVETLAELLKDDRVAEDSTGRYPYYTLTHSGLEAPK